MHVPVCIYVYTPEYNPIPYVTCVSVFRTGHLALAHHLVCSFLRRTTSPAPSFAPLKGYIFGKSYSVNSQWRGASENKCPGRIVFVAVYCLDERKNCISPHRERNRWFTGKDLKSMAFNQSLGTQTQWLFVCLILSTTNLHDNNYPYFLFCLITYGL